GYRYSLSDQQEAAFLGNSFQFPIDFLSIRLFGTTLIGTIVNNGLFSAETLPRRTVMIENEVALTGTGGWEMKDNTIAGDGVGDPDRLIVGIGQYFHDPIFDVDGLTIDNIGVLHAAGTTYNSPVTLTDIFMTNGGTIRPVGPFGGGTVDNTNGVFAIGGSLGTSNNTDTSIPAFENLRLVGGTLTQSQFWAGVAAASLGSTTAARTDTFNTDFVANTFASPLFSPLTTDQFVTALETSPVPNPASLGHFQITNVPRGAAPAQPVRLRNPVFKTHALLPHTILNGTLSLEPGAVVIAGKLDLQNGELFFDFDDTASPPAAFFLDGLNASPATDEVSLTGPNGAIFTIPAGLDFRANGRFGDDRVRIINQGTLRPFFTGGAAQTLTFDPVGDRNSSASFSNEGLIALPAVARAFSDTLVFSDGHFNNTGGTILLPEGVGSTTDITDSLIVGGVIRGEPNISYLNLSNSTLRNVQLENIDIGGSGYSLEEVNFIIPGNTEATLTGTTFLGNSVLDGNPAAGPDFTLFGFAVGPEITDRLTITEQTRVEGEADEVTNIINRGRLDLSSNGSDFVRLFSSQVDSGVGVVDSEDEIYFNINTGQLDSSLVDLGLLEAGGTLNARASSSVKNEGLIEVAIDLVLDAVYLDNSGGTLIAQSTLQSNGSIIENKTGLIQVRGIPDFFDDSSIGDTIITGGTLTGYLNGPYQETELFIASGGSIPQSVSIFEDLSIQAPVTVKEGTLLFAGENDLGQNPVTHGRIVNQSNVSIAGSLTSSSGTLPSGVAENTGVVAMAGGTTNFVISYSGGTVTGSGTIEDLQLLAQDPPAASPPAAAPAGLPVSSPAILRFSLRGTSQGESYDFLQTTTLTSEGTDIQVVLEEDFIPCGSDLYTVFSTSDTIAPSDFNVADGAFVNVTDADTGSLIGTIQVHFPGANTITLSNFEPDGLIYVDLAATGANNGTSWANAYNYLPDAIANAIANPGVVKQIWVAAGTYYPDETTAQPSGSGSRSDAFVLPPDVLIFGGFPANGGGPSCARDPAANPTILSGDINGSGNLTGNSYHIVDALSSNANSLLDGFTITGGNCDGAAPNDRGGGITLGSTSPRLANLIFLENRARFGGALHTGASQELQLYYDFDASEFAGFPTPDSSDFERDGLVINDNNGVNKNITGQVGDGVFFDGNSDQIDATAFDVTDSFSIAMWINPSSTANGQAFIGKHTSNGDNLILFGFYGGGYHFRIRSLAFEVGTPTTGWQHLAVVCTEVPTATNQTRVTVYKDGAPIGATQILVTEVGNVGGGKAWTIGQDWDTPGGSPPTQNARTSDFFTGSMDEVSVWNGALTPDQITTLYQGGRADVLGSGIAAAQLTNVAFLGNYTDIAGGSGGACYLTNDAKPSFTNTLFVGNYSSTLGGAMRAFNSDPTFTNSTLAYNDAPTGDAFYLDGGSIPLLFNNIFWGNPVNFAGPNASNVDGSDNLIQGEAIGGYVTENTDPLFLTTPSPGTGGWINAATNNYGNLRYNPTSPAASIGDPAALPAGVTTDLDRGPRQIPFGLELGPYENQVISAFGSDVNAPVSQGREFAVPNWTPDMTAFNDGAGLDFTFTLTSIVGSLSFDADPRVDAEGALRFTLTERTVGSATFEVVASDPGGQFADSVPITFTITSGTIHYVDENAPGPTHDGTSWTNAFLHLQDAMDVAGSDDDIWVAQGTYKPDEGATPTPGDANAFFDLPFEVDLYGGFPTGGGDGTFTARDPATYVTTLSGDLSGDDDSPGGSNAENSLLVLNAAIASGSQAVLRFIDGFTIKGAKSFGGISFNGLMSISHCIFEGNNADSGGGAASVVSGSLATFSFCVFNSNSANFGGALQINSGATVTVNDCQFTANQAGSGGAVIDNSSGSEFNRCTFTSNIAVNGGALRLDGASPTIQDCVFRGNDADVGSGGAILNRLGANPTISNCLFQGNEGFNGGAIHNFQSSPTIINS
ncbi:MAG: LamG-like jellyroll fold domain-containing protein, partial [Verrucomicrobiota bacterium]